MRRERIGVFASARSAPVRRRRAFTLVELSVVCVVLSIVTAGTYRLFSRLNDSVRITTKHDLAVREAYRLSTSFRDDVRQARDVQVIDQGKTIRLVTSDGTVMYGLTRQGITYTFSPRSDLNYPMRRDLFICPIDDSLQCRIDFGSRFVALPVMAGVVSANSQTIDLRTRPIELIERFTEAL